MVDFLQTIHNQTSGSEVICGGVAKWLNGYLDSYEKNWIDITIPSTVTSSLDTLGERLELEGPTTFPHPIKHQYILKTPTYILDVFVNDTNTPEFSVISGSNILTPQADLDHHILMSSSIQNEYLHNKVQDLKTLYGL